MVSTKVLPRSGCPSRALNSGRRLGRLRLVPHPVPDHPPVNKLGFDPVLSHPTLEQFEELIRKKKGTTKGMIMDQAFSAGVGNVSRVVLGVVFLCPRWLTSKWVADEVLYQARIHPACPVPALSPKDVESLHFQLRHVCETAVNVNADHKKFPEDWLFRWRWSKGKKQGRGSKKHQSKDESEEDADEDLKPRNKNFLALVGNP